MLILCYQNVYFCYCCLFSHKTFGKVCVVDKCTVTLNVSLYSMQQEMFLPYMGCYAATCYRTPGQKFAVGALLTPKPSALCFMCMHPVASIFLLHPVQPGLLCWINTCLCKTVCVNFIKYNTL